MPFQYKVRIMANLIKIGNVAFLQFSAVIMWTTGSTCCLYTYMETQVWGAFKIRKISMMEKYCSLRIKLKLNVIENGNEGEVWFRIINQSIPFLENSLWMKEAIIRFRLERLYFVLIKSC